MARKFYDLKKKRFLVTFPKVHSYRLMKYLYSGPLGQVRAKSLFFSHYWTLQEFFPDLSGGWRKSRLPASTRLSTPWLQTHRDPGLIMDILCSKLEGKCPLLHSANQVPNIDRCTPDIWLWPWPLNSTFDLNLNLLPWPQRKPKGNEQWCPNRFFSIWPCPLT